MDRRNVAASDGGGNVCVSAPPLRAGARSRTAVLMLAASVIALGVLDVVAAPDHHRHTQTKNASATSKKAAKPEHGSHKGHAAAEPRRHDNRRGDAKHSAGPRHNDRKDTHAVPLPHERPVPALPPELSATRQAIELIRQHKFSEVNAIAASLSDPLGRKLVEWALLRHPDSDVGLARYSAFLRANPDWPGVSVLRRRVEEKLWQERRDASTLRRLVGEPSSIAGRLALASAEWREGKRASAEGEVRALWRSAQLSPELETVILSAFPGALTRADHVARMDRRIGARDFATAMRAAKHVSDDHVAIVKACSAAVAKSAKAGAALDQVPPGVRSNLGYVLCRLNALLSKDPPGANASGDNSAAKGDVAAAVKLMLAASPDDLKNQDTDQWWRQRRLLARRLLDLNEPRTAYRIVHEAAAPANPYYRADFHFMPGWIALRFLNDPATALKHFAHVDEGASDPIVLARAAYWRGRAAEAAGQVREMRGQYERAAHFPTAYYGQLARARLGLGEIAPLRPLPEHAPETAAELVHAADILYKINDKNLVRSFLTDLADESSNAAALAALGRLTAQYDDAQSMLLMGKKALARGLALDHYAFPAIGVPAYSPVGGGKVDRCIVYSIVRTESSFDPRDKSSANAVGLMQVTPSAGRDTAKRFGIAYDWDRLASDPVYNTQMGVAEIAGLLQDYRGSYILTFAGYNAGRGRVRQWVAQHGDPRDPKVDAVDWVERIPFSETRNYVQRVMENLQVYRARFSAPTPTVEPNLHRAATLQ